MEKPARGSKSQVVHKQPGRPMGWWRAQGIHKGVREVRLGEDAQGWTDVYDGARDREGEQGYEGGMERLWEGA